MVARYAIRYDDGSLTVLPPIEGVLLLALMVNRRLTRAAASEICWPDADVMPDCWNWALSAHSSKLRTKLRRGGWTITSRFGWGWELRRCDEAEAILFERQYRSNYPRRHPGMTRRKAA